jgi:hypothetical protein
MVRGRSDHPEIPSVPDKSRLGNEPRASQHRTAQKVERGGFGLDGLKMQGSIHICRACQQPLLNYH